MKTKEMGKGLKHLAFFFRFIVFFCIFAIAYV